MVQKLRRETLHGKMCFESIPIEWILFYRLLMISITCLDGCMQKNSLKQPTIHSLKINACCFSLILFFNKSRKDKLLSDINKTSIQILRKQTVLEIFVLTSMISLKSSSIVDFRTTKKSLLQFYYIECRFSKPTSRKIGS